MIIVLILGFIFAYLLVLDTQTRVGSEESYDWSGEEPFSGSILVYFDMFGLIVHQFDLLKNLIVSQRNWNSKEQLRKPKINKFIVQFYFIDI